MGVKRSLILIGGNMSDYSPVLTVIPLPGKFANIFAKKLRRKRVEDTEQALMHRLRQKSNEAEFKPLRIGFWGILDESQQMRKRKGKDVPFWEFDFAPCWLDAGLFLTLWKWLFTHVLVSLYSLSQMLNAVPQYRMIFKLLLSNLHVTKYHIAM